MLECNASEREILQRALQFDRGVLQSVVIDEVSFIEVSVPTDLLPVILINHANVLREVGLVVETVQALAWSQFAETIDLLRLLVKNPVIRDKGVSGLLKDTINFILNIAEAPQACFGFQLETISICMIRFEYNK